MGINCNTAKNSPLRFCNPYDFTKSHPTTSLITIDNSTKDSITYTKHNGETGKWNIGVQYEYNVPYCIYVYSSTDLVFYNNTPICFLSTKNNYAEQIIKLLHPYTKMNRIPKEIFDSKSTIYYFSNSVVGKDSITNLYIRKYYVDWPVKRIDNNVNTFNNTAIKYLTGTVSMTGNPDFVGLHVTSITKNANQKSYTLWDDGNFSNLPGNVDIDVVIKVTGFDVSIMESIDLFKTYLGERTIDRDGYYRIQWHYEQNDEYTGNYILFAVINLIDGLTDGQTYDTDLKIEVLPKQLIYY